MHREDGRSNVWPGSGRASCRKTGLHLPGMAQHLPSGEAQGLVSKDRWSESGRSEVEGQTWPDGEGVWGVSLTEAVGRTLRSALAISVGRRPVMPRPLHPSIAVWLFPQGTYFGGNTFPSRPSRSPRNQASGQSGGHQGLGAVGNPVALASVPPGEAADDRPRAEEGTWTGILGGDRESGERWHQRWGTRASIVALHLSAPQLPHLPTR